MSIFQKAKELKDAALLKATEFTAEATPVVLEKTAQAKAAAETAAASVIIAGASVTTAIKKKLEGPAPANTDEKPTTGSSILDAMVPAVPEAPPAKTLKEDMNAAAAPKEKAPKAPARKKKAQEPKA